MSHRCSPDASDPAWEGRWGEDPPYHAPVFVTDHAREPLTMKERLFAGVGELELEPVATRHTPLVTHVRDRVLR